MRTIAIIPARSGSKGLPGKNIKLLEGKPLLAYTIEAAIKSEKFDKVFVSTDSQEYADIATEYGGEASFLRSKETSSDEADSWDAIREVISVFESRGICFDMIALLQPTSPLRTEEDICKAFDVMYRKQANSVRSVVEMDHSPLWCNTLPEDGCMNNFIKKEYEGIPRQLLPTYYRLNGAIYILSREELKKKDMFVEKSFAYVMPSERSVDIDTELDFKFAEILLKISVGVL